MGEQTSSLLYKITKDGIFSRGEKDTDGFWGLEPSTTVEHLIRGVFKAVIKPFRKKVMDVVKIQYSGGRQSIRIRISRGDCAELPFFKNDTMYKGMKVGKYYTPEELGL